MVRQSMHHVAGSVATHTTKNLCIACRTQLKYKVPKVSQPTPGSRHGSAWETKVGHSRHRPCCSGALTPSMCNKRAHTNGFKEKVKVR